MENTDLPRMCDIRPGVSDIDAIVIYAEAMLARLSDQQRYVAIPLSEVGEIASLLERNDRCGAAANIRSAKYYRRNETHGFFGEGNLRWLLRAVSSGQGQRGPAMYWRGPKRKPSFQHGSVDRNGIPSV